MQANKVVDFFSHLINKLEPEFTLRLRSIEFSAKHGHEICVMQLAGKNAFPKYTPEEILANPKAMVGLSPQDAAAIAKLDIIIKERKRKCQVLEVDRNGTILLRDASGRVRRYSEKHLSNNREMLNNMRGEDAHDLGYRVGFRDGSAVKKYKRQAIDSFKDKVKQLLPKFKIIKK
jgi:hypothetical protein